MRATDRKRLAGLRLASQQLVGSTLTTPAEVADWMFALQAQDLAAAKWALGVRSPGSSVEDVDAAFASGAIVRSWPFRGTLHVVAGRDLGWMLELTAERTVRGMSGRHRQLGLDPETFARASDVATGALRGGGGLSRAALLAEFGSRGIDTSGQRGTHLLWYLSHEGLLCFGPTEGTGQALVLLDEWVPEPRRLSRAEALTELALRFFTSRGPATLKDFLWWSKLLVPDGAAGLAGARDRLRELDVDGTSYWMSAELPESPPSSRPGIVLLPGFDEYLLGYQTRDAVLDAEHSALVVPGNNGIFLPLIVAGGRIVGTWRRGNRAATVSVEAVPFDRLTDAQTRGFLGAAERYARFLGKTVRAAG